MRNYTLHHATYPAKAHSGPDNANFIDLTGQSFGRLTALEYAGKSRWLCKCECGVVKTCSGKMLRDGRTQSCGCLQRELATVNATTHGMHGTLTYKRWGSMLSRCYDHGNGSFKRYGARGITVCDRWRESFENFLADMGECPSSKHTLDRYPNQNGNYESSNCRWATAQAQARNRCTNHLLTFNGETLTLAEWQDRTGIPSATIRNRIAGGWGVSEALLTPVNNQLTFRGKTLTIPEWTKVLGFQRTLIYTRLKNGWSVEKTLSTPASTKRKT